MLIVPNVSEDNSDIDGSKSCPLSTATLLTQPDFDSRTTRGNKGAGVGFVVRKGGS